MKRLFSVIACATALTGNAVNAQDGEDPLAFHERASYVIGQMMACDADFVANTAQPAKVRNRANNLLPPSESIKIAELGANARNKGLNDQLDKKTDQSCDLVRRRYIALGISLLDVPSN